MKKRTFMSILLGVVFFTASGFANSTIESRLETLEKQISEIYSILVPQDDDVIEAMQNVAEEDDNDKNGDINIEHLVLDQEYSASQYMIHIESLGFEDKFIYKKDGSVRYDYSAFSSGDSQQVAVVKMWIQNFGLKSINTQRLMSDIQLEYASTYPFDGVSLMYNPDYDQRYPFDKHVDTPPLVNSEIILLFRVPNVVETNNERVDLTFLFDGQKYTCQLR